MIARIWRGWTSSADADDYLEYVERTGMAELDALVDAARALADKLEPLPSLREKGGAAMARGPDAALLERSGITGRSNPLAALHSLRYGFERPRHSPVSSLARAGRMA